MAHNPKDYETLAAIGAAYGKLGEYATAVTYFKKAVAVNPSYADAYAGLKEAVRLDPNLADAHFALGLAYVSVGDRENALNEVTHYPASTHSRLPSFRISLEEVVTKAEEVGVPSERAFETKWELRLKLPLPCVSQNL